MLRRPTEVALRHFDVLYSTFLLRSWVTSSNESACRDEYVGLLDHLHGNYAPDFDITQHFRDLIDFLMSLEYMQNRVHLVHLFKLCCLCATSCSPGYPIVTMGTLNTTGFQSRSTDVVLPAQSYLSGVPESLAIALLIRNSVIFRYWLLPSGDQLSHQSTIHGPTLMSLGGVRSSSLWFQPIALPLLILLSG